MRPICSEKIIQHGKMRLDSREIRDQKIKIPRDPDALRLQKQIHLLRSLQGRVWHDSYRVDQEEFVAPLFFRI